MVNRAPILVGQRQLYNTLYAASGGGMKNVDLLTELKITRQQLAGVLGALGRRVNNTKGLANKGGIGLVFEIKMTNDGNRLYIMRPILRKALEEEGLV